MNARHGIAGLLIVLLVATGAMGDVLESYDGDADGNGSKASMVNQPITFDRPPATEGLYQGLTVQEAYKGSELTDLALTLRMGKGYTEYIPVTVNMYEGWISEGQDLTQNIVASGTISGETVPVLPPQPPTSTVTVPLTGNLPARADGKYSFAVVADTHPTGVLRLFVYRGMTWGETANRYDGGDSIGLGGLGKAWADTYPLAGPLLSSGKPQWQSAEFELTGRIVPEPATLALLVGGAAALLRRRRS